MSSILLLHQVSFVALQINLFAIKVNSHLYKKRPPVAFNGCLKFRSVLEVPDLLHPIGVPYVWLNDGWGVGVGEVASQESKITSEKFSHHLSTAG